MFNFPTFSWETNRIWEVKQTWEWLLGWNIFLLSRALTTQSLSVWVLLSFFLSLSRVFYLYLFGIFLVVAIVRTISFTNAFSAVDRLEHPMVLRWSGFDRADLVQSAQWVNQDFRLSHPSFLSIFSSILTDPASDLVESRINTSDTHS